jgi:hypothetical protein
MAPNAPATWSLSLGVLSLPLLFGLWPASPPLAVAAIVCGLLGLRSAGSRGGAGKTRAVVGIICAAVALALFALLLVLFATSDFV